MILPIGRLKKRVAAGRIGLTGMMLNMSEIADESVLAASLAPLCEMRAAFGDAVRKLPVEGGPLALVRNGDVISMDAEKNTLEVALSAAELAKRRAEWTMPPYMATRGTLYKYIKNVKNASEGCVTDE